MAALEYAFQELIDELDYCNLNQRGYLTVTFDRAQVVADWKFIDTVKGHVNTNSMIRVVINRSMV